MIRVTIEIVPNGDETRCRTAALATIVNGAVQTAEMSTYCASATEAPCAQDKRAGWASATTLTHCHAHGVVALVGAALTAIASERRGS